MQRLSHCENCGNEIPSDAIYCPNCGSKVEFSTRRRRDWTGDDYYYRRRGDWWGLVAAAGFLVVFGLTFATYPDLFGRIGSYLESFAAYGHPVLPSYNLGQVLIYFFNLCGIWGLIAATLRFVVTNSAARSARDGVGAIFAFYTANILTQFYAGAFGGWGLVGMWLVGLFAVIVADALITLLVPRRIPLYAR